MPTSLMRRLAPALVTAAATLAFGAPLCAMLDGEAAVGSAPPLVRAPGPGVTPRALGAEGAGSPQPDTPTPSVATPAASAADDVTAEPGASAADNAELRAAPDWVRSVYERSVGSVVMVDADGRTGTGFCLFAPEYIVTALHVVDDALAIRVESVRGHRRHARVVTYSEEYDLALLRLDRPLRGMTPLPIERAASVGDGVAVIGHPLAPLARQEPKLRGLLAWSLSNGIIGAVSGSWLQTNAALNPGVSGGPVLDRDGRVIGVVSARVRDAQNIGMISRIEHAEELLGDLGRGGPPRRVVKLDKVEIGVVIQWGEDTLSGITAGAGLRVLDDLVLKARAGLLDGAAEPQAATVLTSHVTRIFVEAVAGYAVSLPGHVTLTPEVGAAVGRDRREDSALLAARDPSCVAPPCLVAGDVVHDQSVGWPFWPLLGISAEWGLLRLGYALQIEDPTLHRVMATFAF